jgi:hypothetical protein
MKRKRHRPEQIIAKLREAEAGLPAAPTIGRDRQKLAVSEQTFHRRRNRYGGLRASDAKRLNGAGARERAVQEGRAAVLTLDPAIVREARSGNYRARRGAMRSIRWNGNWPCPTRAGVRRRELRASGKRLQLPEDFAVFWEAALVVFAEDPFPVDNHVEDAAGALDQLRFNAARALDLGRQTGGPRQVVSLHAIGDADLLHPLLLSRSSELAVYAKPPEARGRRAPAPATWFTRRQSLE